MTPELAAKLRSDQAVVCHGEREGIVVWSVLLADGYLLECGRGIGEARANVLADIINHNNPEQLTRQALAALKSEGK